MCQSESTRSSRGSMSSAMGPRSRPSGHLSYGNNSVGMINWSTCLLYPDGPSCDDIMVQAQPAAAARLAVRDGTQDRVAPR